MNKAKHSSNEQKLLINEGDDEVEMFRSFMFPYPFGINRASLMLLVAEFMLVFMRVACGLLVLLLSLSSSTLAQIATGDGSSNIGSSNVIPRTNVVANSILTALVLALVDASLIWIFYSGFPGISAEPILNFQQLLMDWHADKSNRMIHVIKCILLLSVDLAAAYTAAVFTDYIVGNALYESVYVLYIASFSNVPANQMRNIIMEALFYGLFVLTFDLFFRHYYKWHKHVDVMGCRIRIQSGVIKVMLAKFVAILICFPLTGSTIYSLNMFAGCYLERKYSSDSVLSTATWSAFTGDLFGWVIGVILAQSFLSAYTHMRGIPHTLKRVEYVENEQDFETSR